MNYTLKIWRQKNKNDKGGFVNYEVKNIPGDASFLETLDILNVDLVKKGEDAIASFFSSNLCFSSSFLSFIF